MVIYIQALNAEYAAKSDIDCKCPKPFFTSSTLMTGLQVLSTDGVYWCIIETGLGLTAACLPTLYGLFRTQALESIVRSVRSIASLGSSPPGSNRSERSQRSRAARSFQSNHRNASATSQAQNLVVKISRDIEMDPLPPAPTNQIRVEKTFTSAEVPAGQSI